MNKYITLIAVPLALVLPSMAQLGGPANNVPYPIASYGPSPSSWFMQYASTNTTSYLATNNTTGPAYWGYTNTTLFPVNITAGSKVSLGVKVVFPHAFCTNTMTIRAWPSLDGISKVTQDGIGVGAGAFAATILGKGITPVYWATNSVYFKETFAGYPYLVVQFENPTNAVAGDPEKSMAPTNLVITATVKP